MADDYNGWTNRETWQVNLYWGDMFEAGGGVWSAEDMQNFVTKVMTGRITGTLDGSLLGDIIGDFVSAVNWQELEQTHSPETDAEGDDE